MFKKAVLAALMFTAIVPLAQAQDFQRPRHHGRDMGRPPMGDHHGWRGGSRHDDRRGWGPYRGPDRRGYYHGYRGYHDRRPGYRRHSDGLWYPAAAFALGAIIGGALNN